MTLLQGRRLYQVFCNCFDVRTTWTISDLMESKVLGDEKENAEDNPLQPFYEKMLIEMIESDSELEFFKEPERRLKFKNRGLSINDLPPPPIWQEHKSNA